MQYAAIRYASPKYDMHGYVFPLLRYRRFPLNITPYSTIRQAPPWSTSTLYVSLALNPRILNCCYSTFIHCVSSLLALSCMTITMTLYLFVSFFTCPLWLDHVFPWKRVVSEKSSFLGLVRCSGNFTNRGEISCCRSLCLHELRVVRQRA